MSSYSSTADVARGTVWSLPRALSRLRPEACGLLTALNERVWQVGDPGLLELVRVRVAQLIGNPAASRVRCPYAVRPWSRPSSSRCLTTRVRRCSRRPSGTWSPFAEQFVIDVGGTTEDARAELIERFGADGARELVTAIYVVEFTQRLQLIAARLLDDDGMRRRPWSARLPSATRRRPVCCTAYQAAVVRGSTLDPVTTELVRLRCARTHHCRICQTLRLADARAAGVDEAMTAQGRLLRAQRPAGAGQGGAARHRRVHHPAGPAVRRRGGQARTSFGPAELASLCLDITKWSTQKIKVALGTDGADRLVTDADGVALFGFDADGQATGYRRR